MSRLVLIFLRLSLILMAFVLAALSASLFVHLLAWPMLAAPGQEAPWILLGGYFVSIPLAALIIGYYSCIPAAVLIGLAELRGYRSWLFHALAGGGAAALALALARRTGPGGDGPPLPDAYGEVPLIWMPEIMAAVFAAGLAGGLAYWIVAGRSSGNWRQRLRPTAPGPSVS